MANNSNNQQLSNHPTFQKIKSSGHTMKKVGKLVAMDTKEVTQHFKKIEDSKSKKSGGKK